MTTPKEVDFITWVESQGHQIKNGKLWFDSRNNWPKMVEDAFMAGIEIGSHK